MATRPSVLPDFCTNNPTNMVAPSASVVQQGYLPGSVLPAQHFNQILNLQGQWIRFLESSLAANTTLSTIDPNIRMLGGGTFAWQNSSTTLSWSEPVTISYPGLTDSQNQLAAGSVTIPSGSVAYVTTNNPIVMLADVTQGSATLTNVLRPSDVQTGWQVSGAGIPSGATIKAVDVAAQTVTLSANATSTNAQASISFARVGALAAQVAPISSYVATANGVIFARATDNSCIVGVGTGQMHIADTEQRRLLRQGFGTTLMLPAGVAVTAGQAVYISQGTDGRTAGSVYPADASAANGATRGKAIGFVYQAAAAGAQARVVCSGFLPTTQTLIPGATYYLDPASPGAITATRPTALLQYVVPVGQAVTSSSLLLPHTFQATPRTLEAMSDKAVVTLGSMRFENGYKSGTNQACLDIVPGGSGYVFSPLYRSPTRSPYLVQIDCEADSNVPTATMTFSFQYQYDGTYAGQGPYGTANNGITMSVGMTRHGFAAGSQTYFYDARAANFVFDPSISYLGIANIAQNLSSNMAAKFSMTLAYAPA